MCRHLLFESLESRRLLDATIGQWERFDISLPNATWAGNPFDLELTGQFIHADTGRTLTQFGFYAGSDTWKPHETEDECEPGQMREVYLDI